MKDGADISGGLSKINKYQQIKRLMEPGFPLAHGLLKFIVL
jgi:hypothetical protein